MRHLTSPARLLPLLVLLACEHDTLGPRSRSPGSGPAFATAQSLAAGDLFVTCGGCGAGPASVLRYDAITGAFVGVFTSGGSLGFATGLTFGPDGHLYVSDWATNRVLRYDGTTGVFIDEFINEGVAGACFTGVGLKCPQGLIFGPDGNLYVVGQLNHAVLRYDGATGAFIDTFASGLAQPRGVIFGPDGNMYVANTASSNVLRFNGTTGAFIDTFVPSPGLVSPIGLEFGPDGAFYVTSFRFPSSVRKYDGTTGGFIGRFDDLAGGLVDPFDLAFGLDGHLYVAAFGTDDVRRFDGTTGAYLGVFASGGGLVGPQFLEFRANPAPQPPTISGATISRQQGAAASSSTIATVSDPLDPAGSLTVTATAVPAGISVTGVTNTAGTITGNVAASCGAALGSSTVELTATNSSSLTAIDNLIVNVTPSNPPVITLKPSIALSPPNHSYRTVTVAQMVASASDDCDGNLFSSVVIENVTSDEPDNAAGTSDGNTTNDIVIAGGCKSVQLRAERDDTKNGRVYAITLRVSDASGNATRAVFKVTVPKSQSGAPAVQDATAFTVTSGCP